MSGFSSPSSAIVLGQSATGTGIATHTGDTAEFTMATITIPANVLGANGQVVVEAYWSSNSATNSKTQRIRFGGTQFGAQVGSGQYWRQSVRIANRGAANSQVGSNGNPAFGNANSVTAAIDTTASVDITITGQLSVGTDTITLEYYQVLLYPKA